MSQQWRASLGLLLMSASATVALSRLIEHGLRPGVIVPMVLAVIVADRGVALVMRAGLPMVPAILCGSVLSLLALLIGLDPTLINPASSHFADMSLASSQFRAARFALANDGTPLPALVGVTIALGALGAFAAAATRSIWESQIDRERGVRGQLGPLTGCIAPSFGVFVYSTLVSANQGRLPAAVTYFVGVGAFILLSDRAGSGVRSTRRQWRLPREAVLSGAVLTAAVIGGGIGLSGMKLSVFHVTPPGQNQSTRSNGAQHTSEILTGTALVDDLRTIELNESTTVLFHAHSALPTYWQVGALSSFNGTEWVATPGVTSALSGSPSANAGSIQTTTLPTPANGVTFQSSVDITDFASRLLPAPPHAISVQGLPGASPVGQEGVLAASPSQAGTSYSVTAKLPPTQPTDLAQLPLSDPQLAPYLALPAEPAVVTFLAHAAVGSATTQGAQVQALVNWFRTPGRFEYTLNPPPTTGANPLVDFLSVTKAGYCQQFAGAFGILARTLGIPTRLVVGFTSGQAGPNGTYTITGVDAHVWPQVYLGPGSGWISVEPTPPSSGQTGTPAGVVGPTVQQTPTSTPTTQATGGRSKGSHPGTTTPTTPHHAVSLASAGSGVAWWVVLLIVAGALALAGGLLALQVRRRGGLGAESGPPSARVVHAWERAQRALQRRGLGRRLSETPGEYAERVDHFEQRAARPIGAAALRQLAVLVEAACYGPTASTTSEAEAARGWATSVIEANRRRSRAAV